MNKEQIYDALISIPMSHYYRKDPKRISKRLKIAHARRYLVILALENGSQLSDLHLISEANSSVEQSGTLSQIVLRSQSDISIDDIPSDSLELNQKITKSSHSLDIERNSSPIEYNKDRLKINSESKCSAESNFYERV